MFGQRAERWSQLFLSTWNSETLRHLAKTRGSLERKELANSLNSIGDSGVNFPQS